MAKTDSPPTQPVIVVRPAADRGTTRLPWLDSRHTFSFGDYDDPDFRGWRALRVINDDRVAPASGFGSHPHRDMEIVTLVLAGTLEHRDSLGNGSALRPGEVQRMTAGTGIIHSEWNPSKSEPVHLLQIWILPRRRSATPGYAQRPLPEARNVFAPVVAGDPVEAGTNVVTIDADADLWRAVLDAGTEVVHPLRRSGHGWLHVAKGRIALPGGRELAEGDGAALAHARDVRVTASEDAEVLLFDLG